MEERLGVASEVWRMKDQVPKLLHQALDRFEANLEENRQSLNEAKRVDGKGRNEKRAKRTSPTRSFKVQPSPLFWFLLLLQIKQKSDMTVFTP